MYLLRSRKHPDSPCQHTLTWQHEQSLTVGKTAVFPTRFYT